MTDADIAALRVGSVVRTPTGYRVVRGVSHRGRSAWGAGLPQGSVTFTIQRRSWTGRATTTVMFTDLRCRKYQATTVIITLDDPLSRAIADEIEHPMKADRLHPSAVRGIP